MKLGTPLRSELLRAENDVEQEDAGISLSPLSATTIFQPSSRAGEGEHGRLPAYGSRPAVANPVRGRAGGCT